MKLIRVKSKQYDFILKIFKQKEIKTCIIKIKCFSLHREITKSELNKYLVI